MIKLVARPEPSKFWTYASPVLALAVTVVIGVLLFMALGKDPVKGLSVFFLGADQISQCLERVDGQGHAAFDHCVGPGRVLSIKCVEHWR